MIFNKKKQKILLFVGSPRSGTTFIGQIINYHPNCLVSNEYSFLHKIIVEKIKLTKAIKEMKTLALKQYQSDLSNDSKYGQSIDRYQPKWNSFHELLEYDEFLKKNIKMIGDKKAGGTSLTFSRYPNDVINFFKNKSNYSFYFIQVIRNPIQSAYSYIKSHKIDTFEHACNEILKRSKEGMEMTLHTGIKNHRIYYEDLVENSIKTIKEVFIFFELEITDFWINKISEKVNPLQLNIDNKKDIETSLKLVKKYKLEKVFNRYY